jgi:YHS domain-containing protein
MVGGPLDRRQKVNHMSQEAVQLDPVCGMKVRVETAKVRYAHEDTTYYFCCPGCLEKFRSDPGKYAKFTSWERQGQTFPHRRPCPFVFHQSSANL